MLLLLRLRIETGRSLVIKRKQCVGQSGTRTVSRYTAGRIIRRINTAFCIQDTNTPCTWINQKVNCQLFLPDWQRVSGAKRWYELVGDQTSYYGDY